MKTILKITALLLTFQIACAVSAQETAAQWAEKNKEALAAINDAALADVLKKGEPALAALFAEVKTGGVSDAVASTRIAALTQYVMMPGRGAERKAYAAALLAAAQRATDADVTCFFLNQLRWCGLPQQADALRAFEQSKAPGVADLATMTVQAVTDDRSSKAAPPADTRYSAFSKELAGLKPKALAPRLLEAFDDPDPAIAGMALAQAARTSGGKAETALWTAKLAAADPARRTMLLDMLASRGDKSACDAVAALLADPDSGAASAAQRALIALDPSAFADRLPSLLKGLPPDRLALVRDNVRVLGTQLLKKPLVKPYDTFSETGKKLALEIIKERRIAEAAELGLAALDAKDDETAIAGYRLLREVADKSVAETLIAKLLASSGRVTPEAQNAVAAAARRDTTGAYAAALAKALQNASEAQKPVALETAARVGGDALLKAVAAAAEAANAEAANAAVRALADWPDQAPVPALLRIAATSANAKQQTLALRGLTKKLDAPNADKKAAEKLWLSLKTGVADEARRKSIDDLFKQEVNVALNKPATASVPQEGDNAVANINDGTLEKAWFGASWPAQAQIDLGSVLPLHAAHVTFYHDGRTYTFKLEISEDGQTWKTIASNEQDPKPATEEGLRIDFPDTPARYARLTVLKNSVNQAVHVLELKLFSNTAP